DDVERFSVHQEPEAGILLRVLLDEIQKVPLRHEREKFAVRRKMGEVGDGHDVWSDLPGQFADFLMGAFEELVKQAELVDEIERRRMDRVAAKVSQEIGVLFEHDDINAHARQQEAQHHAGRASADYAAPGAQA